MLREVVTNVEGTSTNAEENVEEEKKARAENAALKIKLREALAKKKSGDVSGMAKNGARERVRPLFPSSTLLF